MQLYSCNEGRELALIVYTHLNCFAHQVFGNIILFLLPLYLTNEVCDPHFFLQFLTQITHYLTTVEFWQNSLYWKNCERMRTPLDCKVSGQVFQVFHLVTRNDDSTVPWSLFCICYKPRWPVTLLDTTILWERQGKRIQNNSNCLFLPNRNNSNEDGRCAPKQAHNFLLCLLIFFSACYLQILSASWPPPYRSSRSFFSAIAEISKECFSNNLLKRQFSDITVAKNVTGNGQILTCNPVLNCLSLILECWNTESTMRGCLLIQLTNSALVSFPFYRHTDSQSVRWIKRYNTVECDFSNVHCSPLPGVQLVKAKRGKRCSKRNDERKLHLAGLSFYFFARHFLRCAPNKWTPGRGYELVRNRNQKKRR